MTVRVHRSTWGTYWRWTCDACDLWDSAGDWDEAMEAATGHAVYRHARPAPRLVIPDLKYSPEAIERLRERLQRINVVFARNPEVGRYKIDGPT